MASQTPPCESQAPPEAPPRGAARWRRPFARGALSAARVRSLAALDRVALRRKAARVAVMPTVRYRDVPAAIAWLCAAFGMEVHRVVAGEGGAPRYAELRFGGNLLMIVPIEDTAFGRLMVQPDEIGGVETQICYLHVEDVALHYARARAAGAEVVLDIEDEANSGRGYSCRDPEGHVWNFGTYHPWQKPGTGSDRAGRHRRRERNNGLSVLLLLLLAALLTSDPVPPLAGARTGAALADTQTEEPAAIERHKREAAEGAARDERERQAQLHGAALAAAEKGAAAARSELAEARAAQQKAEREAAAARARAGAMLSAKLAAEGAAEKAKASLAAAEKDAKDASTLAALERSRRIAAEHTAARTRRRGASFRVTRPRPRTWCYSPNVPGAPSNRAQRLSGFCKS